MTQPVEGTQNPEVKKVEGEIDETIAAIDKQEEKVENASTPAEEEKATETLNKLLAKFDALTERLNGIDAKLAEPTVPAPPAKETPAPRAATEGDPVVPATEGEDAKPKKRRLGVWG